MWTVESEISEALAELHLSQDQFKALDEDTSEQIVATAKAKFLAGKSRYWWQDINLPYEYYEYDFPSDYLAHHLLGKEVSCYWIPQNEKQALKVYETNVFIVNRIMELTASFEYYVLAKDFSWLMIENDHRQLVVVNT